MKKIIWVLMICLVTVVVWRWGWVEREQLKKDFGSRMSDILAQLEEKAKEVEALKNDDQFKRNQELTGELKNILATYQRASDVYEEMVDLRTSNSKINDQFALALSWLSKRNYASASASLLILGKEIETLRNQALAKAAPIAENAKVSNTAPVAGYSRQVVEAEGQKYAVDIMAASLDSNRVVVETASTGDCANNCPVAPLADYVTRAGGFAGINGPYFCPAEYPSCQGKTNSFDTLLMNKSKYYFNSDNNVYSSVPAIIFSGGGARLVERSSDWGRDTSVDAVIAAQPLLLSGGEVRFGGDGDSKKTAKGNRSFVGYKGNIVYIGVVRNATVAEVAKVLKVLGLTGALNLDSGGSTAFLVNGKYVAGPGRQTPFGIILVRK